MFLRTSRRGNRKERPDWFSKRACVASLRLALASAEAEVKFAAVADGGVPEETEDILEAVGDVDVFNGGNNRRSFARTISTAQRAAIAEGDLVWFCEDDYLYRPDAFNVLLSGAREASASYFALFYPRQDVRWHALKRSQPLTEVRPMAELGSDWRRVSHTTSTFGVRGGVFLSDVWLLRATMFAGGPFAHSMMSAVQGIEPFSWRHLHRDLNLVNGRSVLPGLIRVPARAAINAASRHHARKLRVLISPYDEPIVHLESDHIPSESYDYWKELAAGSYGYRSCKEEGS